MSMHVPDPRRPAPVPQHHPLQQVGQLVTEIRRGPGAQPQRAGDARRYCEDVGGDRSGAPESSATVGGTQ